MSKANYLTHSIIRVAFIVSFKRLAAVSFLALNYFILFFFFLPAVPRAQICRFTQVPSRAGEILHFHAWQSRAQPRAGLHAANKPWAKAIIKTWISHELKEAPSSEPLSFLLFLNRMHFILTFSENFFRCLFTSMFTDNSLPFFLVLFCF